MSRIKYQPTINNMQVVSISEEILKLKQLLDIGAITQNEFDIKKQQLVNL